MRSFDCNACAFWWFFLLDQCIWSKPWTGGHFENPDAWSSNVWSMVMTLINTFKFHWIYSKYYRFSKDYKYIYQNRDFYKNACLICRIYLAWNDLSMNNRCFRLIFFWKIIDFGVKLKIGNIVNINPNDPASRM